MSSAPLAMSTDEGLVRFAGPQVAYRDTRDGRRLMYECVVIQQPERARACGSGAKSASDRRPVDPPPVVELKVFDVTYPEKRDITFYYNANFFLSASLEVDPPPPPHARNAQAPPPANQAPVLTGAPIAGMAYLDRPEQAGYFIFPDLSVRHEGRYRLRFDLFEEIKNLRDREPIPYNATEAERRDADASSFDWRLITMSAPFQVYSAKKFPGLAESTALSRCVADQGCRVRIRRDVRMRRRDNKARNSVDNAGEHDGPRRTSTPQASVHEVIPRPRSVSQGSISHLPSTGDHRPSDQYEQRSYNQPYPSTTSSSVQASSHYYAPPSHYPQQRAGGYQAQQSLSAQYRHTAPPAPAPAPPSLPAAAPAPSQQSIQSNASHYQSEYYRPPLSSNNSYNQEQPRSQYDVENKARDEYKRASQSTQSYDDHTRRSSVAYGPSPTSTQYNNYGRSSSVAYPPPQQSYANNIPPLRTPTALAPLQMRMPSIESRYNTQPPSTAVPLSATSISSTSGAYSNDRSYPSNDVTYGPPIAHQFGPNAVTNNHYNSSTSSAYNTPSSSGYGPALQNNTYNNYSMPSISHNNNNGGSKRSWESAFQAPQTDCSTNEAFSNQRQKFDNTIDRGSIQTDEYNDLTPYVDEVTNLAYKRADGHVMVRPLPKVQ